MISPFWLWACFVWHLLLLVLFGELLVCNLNPVSVSRCNGCSCTFFVQTIEGDRPISLESQCFRLWCAPDQTRRRFGIGTLHIGAMVRSFDEGLSWLSCCVHKVLSDSPISSCLLFQFAQLHISRAVFLMHAEASATAVVIWEGVVGIRFSKGAVQGGHMPPGGAKASYFICSANMTSHCC